jgi:hypothetical protein
MAVAEKKRNVYPFGRGVFEKNAFGLKRDLRKICFTGDKAELISPNQSLCLRGSRPFRRASKKEA